MRMSFEIRSASSSSELRFSARASRIVTMKEPSASQTPSLCSLTSSVARMPLQNRLALKIKIRPPMLSRVNLIERAQTELR